jgi:hypothetical protein
LKRSYWSLSTGLLVVLSSGLAMANTVTYITPVGSTTSGGTVNAQAAITTGAGSVTIDLANLLTAAQMTDVAQALTDLSFTLSGTFASGLVSDTNRTYSGKLIDIGSGGAVTTDSGDGIAASYNRWFFTNSGSTFLLEDLGTGMPKQSIVGGTAGSTSPYTGANGSITSNGPHNPFIQGKADFTLTIAGVTAATNVTGVIFSFGTTAGSNLVTGILAPVPEPRFVSLLLIGGLLMAMIYRKRAAVQ